MKTPQMQTQTKSLLCTKEMKESQKKVPLCNFQPQFSRLVLSVLPCSLQGISVSSPSPLTSSHPFIHIYLNNAFVSDPQLFHSCKNDLEGMNM